MRESNQDACCMRVANTNSGALSMAIVCDGVGGLAHGEVASSYVTKMMASWFSDGLPGLLAVGDATLPKALDNAWDELLWQAHSQIMRYGARQHELMGTTFTGILAYRGEYMVAQVGDSRLYHLHDGVLERVTEDQTMAAELVALGELDATDVATHPSRHVIMQAVGVGNDLHPLFTAGRYEPRDLFVLCTDGVYGRLGDAGIGACVRQVDQSDGECLETLCRILVDCALAAGETDNLTVACFFGDPLLRMGTDTVVVGGTAW